MWDTGASFSLITTPLAHELGLTWTSTRSNAFKVVSGSRLQSAGVATNLVLRLHEDVELVIAKLRVVESSDMSLILGQDIISSKGEHWRRRGQTTENGRTSV